MRRIYFLVLVGHLLWGLSVNLNTARIAYYNEKDYPRAKKACLEGIKTENNYELYAILSGSEIGLGNWQEGAAALIKAIAIDSVKTWDWIGEKGGGNKYFGQAFYFSARTLFDQEKYPEALEYLRYAEFLDPADIAAYVLGGAILFKLGKYEEANAEYKKVLERDPENPDVHFLIGKSLFESKNFEASLGYLQNAQKYYLPKYDRITKVVFQNLQEFNPQLSQKIIVLWAEKKSNELDELLKIELGFKQGMDAQQSNIEQYYRTTTDLARTHYFTGMAHFYLGNDSIALTSLFKNLELNPNDLDALFFTGEILVKLKKCQAAIGYFEKLTQIKDGDLYAWFSLGVCYTKLKEYNKAIDIYENKVLKLDPENIDAMNNLAYIYSEIGEKDKAVEYWKKVEELQKE